MIFGVAARHGWMNVAETLGWWNCDETMGLMEPQAVLSWQGWVEGDGPSSSKKCQQDKLRCEQYIRNFHKTTLLFANKKGIDWLIDWLIN